MHHVIVKSEAAVRGENERMKREIETLRADNNRLREMVGEEPVRVISHVAANHGDVATFTAGECKVTIVRPPGPPAMNPQAAAARGQVAARPAAVAPRQIVAPQAQPQTQQVTPLPTARRVAPGEIDESELRFALLELK